MPPDPGDPIFSDPQAARDYLESIRWPAGPVCPLCAVPGRARRLLARRPGLWKCAACRKQFTVTVRTLFQDSSLPLETWLSALARLRASRRGATATDLQQSFGLTYKSAWRMLDLACYAMSRPKPDRTAVGQSSPVSFYPTPLATVVLRCLQTLPKRLHPDALERANQRLEERRAQSRQ